MYACVSNCGMLLYLSCLTFSWPLVLRDFNQNRYCRWPATYRPHAHSSTFPLELAAQPARRRLRSPSTHEPIPRDPHRHAQHHRIDRDRDRTEQPGHQRRRRRHRIQSDPRHPRAAAVSQPPQPPASEGGAAGRRAATGTRDPAIIGTAANHMPGSAAGPPSAPKRTTAVATTSAGSHSSASVQNRHRPVDSRLAMPHPRCELNVAGILPGDIAA